MKFKINLSTSSIIKIFLFLAIKDYLSCFNTKLLNVLHEITHVIYKMTFTNILIKQIKDICLHIKNEMT